jgi:uncharacterized protein (DUF433 family)
MKMAATTAREIVERPAYGITEAARYVRMNPTTLQTWALGRVYETSNGVQKWRPLFGIADKRTRRLSFLNLVEASVLASIRKQHGIRIPKIRAALDYVRDSLHIARPLCDEQFQTNGVDLFIERFGDLVNASRQGQMAMREMMQAALRRIEREELTGVPIRLYAAGPDERQRSPFVAFDPAIAFGRPVLIKTGAPIANIADRFRAGDSIDVLVEDYGVERQAIEEAIRQAELLRAA